MAIIYQEFDRTITAGNYAEILLPAAFVAILESSASGDNLEIEFIGDAPQPRTPIRAGIGVLVPDFGLTKMRFWNAGASSIDIKIAVSDSIISDNRLTFTTALPVKGGTGRETVAASTVTTSSGVLIAENTNRTSLLVQNNGTVDIWVGDSNVALTRGTKVKPDGVFETASSAALYAIADGSSNTAINLHEETV